MNKETKDQKEEILTLIKKIQEFNESHREELTEEISKRIQKIASSKPSLQTIIKETELGQKLFRELKNYINTRFSSLLELVRSDLHSLAPPSASGRLSFEAGMLGRFPITQPALARGITRASIKSALKFIKEKKRHKEIKESITTSKKAKKPPKKFELLHLKRKPVEKARETIKKEVKSTNEDVQIKHLLSRRKRLMSQEEATHRTIALTTLLVNRNLKVKEKEGKLLVVEGKNGN